MHKTRILIVEDEAIVARDIEHQLEIHGYESAGHASTGEEALALAGQVMPDLVLMDIRLAGEMDGIEAARFLREQFSMPVVFLTDFADDQIIQRAKQSEAFAYIIKPFEERQLCTSIEIALCKHTNELRLRGNWEQQQLLIQNLPVGVVVWAPDTSIKLANEEASRLLGISPSQLCGKLITGPLWDIFREDGKRLPPEEHPVAQVSMTRQAVLGKLVGIDRPAADARLWVLVNAYPEFDAQAQLRHVLVTMADVTVRQLAAKALEQRVAALTHPMDQAEGVAFEELFNIQEIQKLQNDFALATGVASCITHPDGTLITAPSNFCRLCKEIIRTTEKGRIYCIHSDAVIGRHHPEGPIIQPCLSGGLWDAGASITVNGRHIAKWLIGQVRDETQSEEQMRQYAREIGANEDMFLAAFRETPAMSREQFQRIAQALFTLAGQLSAMAFQNVQQARIITERHRVEAMLRESEEKYRFLIENASEGIVLIQGERIRLANRKARESIGVGSEDLRNKSFLEFIHPEDRALVAEHHQRRLQGMDSSHAYSFRILFRNIEIRWVELNAVRIRWEGEAATLNFLSDITARKLAEEEKEKLQEHLLQAQKMESVGRLAGGVAHDFNNMLQAILGNVALAMEAPANSLELQEYLQEIQKAAQHSADLTRQLLAFARKQTVSPKILDLNNTLAGMFKMLQRLIGENVRLQWIPGAELWPVRIDPSQLDQILANLMVNARDAMGGAGTITIKTCNVPYDKALPATQADLLPTDYILLAVSDTGTGLNQEAQAHLFEPFFTTKAMGEGIGLGLATVYGIVKQNGGLIHVSSAPGKGTSFNIYLPRSHAPAVPKAKTDKITVPRGAETVLIVEDEEQILLLGRRVLMQQGYQVLAAPTPESALELAAKHPGHIDLLITDVVMPGINGRELHQRMAELRPAIQCLFISGYTAEIIARHGILETGLHFLHKPFTIHGLSQKVRALLDAPRVTPS